MKTKVQSKVKKSGKGIFIVAPNGQQDSDTRHVICQKTKLGKTAFDCYCYDWYEEIASYASMAGAKRYCKVAFGLNNPPVV